MKTKCNYLDWLLETIHVTELDPRSGIFKLSKYWKTVKIEYYIVSTLSFLKFYNYAIVIKCYIMTVLRK